MSPHEYCHILSVMQIYNFYSFLQLSRMPINGLGFSCILEPEITSTWKYYHHTTL